MQRILFLEEGQTAKGAKRQLKKLRKSWERRLLHPRCEDDINAAEMLNAWCEQTDSYWPGVFHCYGDFRIPATNNEMERFIKAMKQLERRLSGNPNPEMRFIRHAAINALVGTRPTLPGEDFLASVSREAWSEAEQRLARRQKKHGLSRLVRRNPERFCELLLERWKQSSQVAPPLLLTRAAA